MTHEVLSEHDFSELSVLAKSDPQEFERRRVEILLRYIERAAPEDRDNLRRIQWYADRVRERADSPVAAIAAYWSAIQGKAGVSGGSGMWGQRLEQLVGELAGRFGQSSADDGSAATTDAYRNKR